MTPRVLIEPARLAGSSVMRCQTDERLVDLVRAGNDRAFEAIVDRYRRPLLRYCARLLPPARAEDAVQQTFLNAFAGLRRGDERIELRPWLYRIAHNASLNALRENGWTHERIEAAGGRPGGESAHDAAERRASLRTVLAAVQQLPERQRDAVILRELEGRTYEQIAIELDATGGAVRQLLNRARNTLRAAATALTPAGVLARFPWGQSGPAIERMSDAASQDGLRSGAARIGGALVASVAVAAGLSEGPRHLPRFDTGARPAAQAPAHSPLLRPGSLAPVAPGEPLVVSVRPRAPETRPRTVVVVPLVPHRATRPNGPHIAPRATPAIPVQGVPVAVAVPRAAPLPAPAPATESAEQTASTGSHDGGSQWGRGGSRSRGDSRGGRAQAHVASHHDGDGRQSGDGGAGQQGDGHQGGGDGDPSQGRSGGTHAASQRGGEGQGSGLPAAHSESLGHGGGGDASSGGGSSPGVAGG